MLPNSALVLAAGHLPAARWCEHQRRKWEAQQKQREAERRAARVAAANAKEKMRTQIFERRQAIKHLRAKPPIRQPVWMGRDTLARPVLVARKYS